MRAALGRPVVPEVKMNRAVSRLVRPLRRPLSGRTEEALRTALSMSRRSLVSSSSARPWTQLIRLRSTKGRASSTARQQS
ncbi:hypothetical protein D3C72_1268720 [compost metagenome]